jgi:hypothetical protein
VKLRVMGGIGMLPGKERVYVQKVSHGKSANAERISSSVTERKPLAAL